MTEPKIPNLRTREALLRLLEEAAKRPMTEEEMRQQRESWVRGMVPSAEDRVETKRLAAGDIGYLSFDETAELVSEAYCDGVAAGSAAGAKAERERIVALMREPSHELVFLLADGPIDDDGSTHETLKMIADYLERQS